MTENIEAALTPAAAIRQIKSSIRKANIGRENENLAVTKIGLVLETVLMDAGGGAFEWKVPFIGLTLKGGVKLTNEDTSSFKLDLVPPVPDDAETEAFATDEFEAQVMKSMEHLRNAVAEAGFEDPKFRLKESQIEVKFVATAEGSLSLIVDTSRKEQVTHTMTLTLGPKSDLAKE